MPARVKRVDWRCPQCGKRKWLRPAEARNRQACSRECGYKVQGAKRVTTGAGLARGERKRSDLRYGTLQCPVCERDFEAKSPVQRYCSQDCAIRNAQSRRSVDKPDPRPCEACGTVFTPRDSRHAGRFCSKACTYKVRGAAWKGGRQVRQNGYAVVWVGKGYPGALSNGYMPEHRYVMQEHLGRPLLRTESVHHINGVRDDNRIENLQLRHSQWHGPGQTLVCLDCGSHNIAHVENGD